MCSAPLERVVPSVPMASLIDGYLLLVVMCLVRWTLLADAGLPILDTRAMRAHPEESTGGSTHGPNPGRRDRAEPLAKPTRPMDGLVGRASSVWASGDRRLCGSGYNLDQRVNFLRLRGAGRSRRLGVRLRAGNPVYYGSYGTERSSGGSNGAIPFDGPIKGQYRRDGVDYFEHRPAT